MHFLGLDGEALGVMEGEGRCWLMDGMSDSPGESQRMNRSYSVKEGGDGV